MKPELVKLFEKKEYLKLKISNLQNTSCDYIDVAEELAEVESKIGKICAEQNKATVEEYLRPYVDTIDSFSPLHTWSMKKKLAPKNVAEPPTAKNDLRGNLVTDKHLSLIHI